MINKFWKYIDVFLYFSIYKLFHINLKESAWNKFRQFVKFGVVGLTNTLISYLVYVFCVSIGVSYLIGNILGFVVSVLNAYYWNNKYVFKINSNDKRVWWKAFIKTLVSYASTGLILSNILLVLWVEWLGINEILAPIITLLVTIPINYIMNKNWAFGNADF